MSTVQLAATTTTPEIRFEPAAGQLAIRGECYPENPLTFFEPIFSTLDRYFANEKPARFAVTLQLQYVNSAATKAFRNLMIRLNALGEAGCEVKVAWEFDPEDDAIEELGTDLVEDLHYLDVDCVAVAPY
jgi:hypothetical protein